MWSFVENVYYIVDYGDTSIYIRPVYLSIFSFQNFLQTKKFKSSCSVFIHIFTLIGMVHQSSNILRLQLGPPQENGRIGNSKLVDVRIS